MSEILITLFCIAHYYHHSTHTQQQAIAGSGVCYTHGAPSIHGGIYFFLKQGVSQDECIDHKTKKGVLKT